MSSVCIDTHVLIWGLKEQSEPSQEEMILKSKRFLKNLEENGIQIMIPSPAYAELLMVIPPDLHPLFGNLISKSFMITPFDAQSASVFAEIWQSKSNVIEELKRHPHNTRAMLKADCMIVSIAVARNAMCIYSEDEGVKKFAEGFIEARSIPAIPEQLTFLVSENE